MNSKGGKKEFVRGLTFKTLAFGNCPDTVFLAFLPTSGTVLSIFIFSRINLI